MPKANIRATATRNNAWSCVIERPAVSHVLMHAVQTRVHAGKVSCQRLHQPWQCQKDGFPRGNKPNCSRRLVPCHDPQWPADYDIIACWGGSGTQWASAYGPPALCRCSLLIMNATYKAGFCPRVPKLLKPIGGHRRLQGATHLVPQQSGSSCQESKESCQQRSAVTDSC